MGCASSSASDGAVCASGADRSKSMSAADTSTVAAKRHPPNSKTETAFSKSCDRLSYSGSATSSIVPPLFGAAASVDTSVISVKDFAVLKDLMTEWKSKILPHQILERGPCSAVSPNAIVSCCQLLFAISHHGVAALKYFSLPTYFNLIDVPAATRILASGNTHRTCVEAADSTGKGVQNVARCVDALLQPVADIFALVLTPSTMSDITSTLTEKAAAAAQDSLFGSSAALGSMGLIDGLGPHEAFLKALSNGFRVLYLTVGGTSGLVGNVSETGLPRLRNLERIVMCIEALFYDTHGDFVADDVEAAQHLSAIADVFRFFGILPKRDPNRSSDYQAPSTALYNQFPYPFVDGRARRTLLSLEFRVHRRRLDPTVVIPSIHDRFATLSTLINRLCQLRIIPRTMTEFGQASCNMAQQCFAAKPIAFSQVLENTSVSPSMNYLGQSPSAAEYFFSRATKMLTSQVGDSLNLRNSFGLLKFVRTPTSVSLHCGAAVADHWEQLAQRGDVIELDEVPFSVTDTVLTSTDEADLGQSSGGLLGLVMVDRHDRVELIIYLKPCTPAESPNDSLVLSPEAMSSDDAAAAGGEAQPTDIWLRKKACPLFIHAVANQLQLNPGLPQLSPEGVALAGASVTSHLGGPSLHANASRRSASAAAYGMSTRSASQHIDSIMDLRARRVVLEMLQQFYFLGWLIAQAIVNNHPLPYKLPVLLFRVLKTYRPSNQQASPPVMALYATRDDFDPTSSTFTAGTSSPTAEEGQEPMYSCHFVATEQDLKESENGASVIAQIAEVREMDQTTFEQLLARCGHPCDLTKEEYIREALIEPSVLTATHKVYFDATFIALADSGIFRSVVWQISSPRELRDMCCEA